MLRFGPLPFGVRRVAAADPAEPIAAFAADEGDHLAIWQKAECRFVGMTGHVEVRDQVVLHAVAAADELELPLRGATLDFAGLGSLLRRRGGSLLGVVGNSVRLTAVPGDAPQPFAFGQHALRRRPIASVL